ncbi:hypothetical protein AMAG_03907 [Allomyces macrogynus ATCC 38327]|uniref:Uncharacterized protein n=1 Tax=Allomyces macrogynus (strain ATCC 38327) TaxID=578462 RepID=A0A0L0S7B9_ALLM3|nr:hypothetical protein AMAG_03907 [Allomyces macrogynus ATCC 38327]|eukprot:KNE58320.1 hypothetical protein AMAG_03907 [Allomyces macrogynus ATCC 38327]
MGALYTAGKTYFLATSLYATMAMLAVPSSPAHRRAGRASAPPRPAGSVPVATPPAPVSTQELRSHLIFWVTVVVLGRAERVGDRVLKYVPLYSTAKWMALIVLMVTRHMGTYLLFTQKLRPWFRKYQKVIELWVSIYPRQALAAALALAHRAYVQYQALSALPPATSEDEADSSSENENARPKTDPAPAAAAAPLLHATMRTRVDWPGALDELQRSQVVVVDESESGAGGDDMD